MFLGASVNLLFQVYFADTILLTVSSGLCKVSILEFYKRIFITKSFQIMCNCVTFLVSAWMIGTFFVSFIISPFSILVCHKLTDRSDPIVQYLSDLIRMASRTSSQRRKLRLSDGAPGNFWYWNYPRCDGAMHAIAAHLEPAAQNIQEAQDCRHPLVRNLLRRMRFRTILLLASSAHPGLQ